MRKKWFTISTIAKITIRAWFRNKVALFFSIIFPLIFLTIFGSLFGKSNLSLKTVVINQSSSPIAQTVVQDINSSKLFKVNKSANDLKSAEALQDKGQIDTIVILPPSFGQQDKNGQTSGAAQVYYNSNTQSAAQAASSILSGFFSDINAKLVKYNPPFTVAQVSTNSQGLTSFDYVFAGMLGFVIITIGIFGPTNTFPEQKKRGVLRRIRTTPITAGEYIIGNVIAYVFTGLISIAIMFLVSLSVFHFHMHGSYISFVLFVALGLITIFGFGIAVGGWAKDEQQAAPLSNIVAFPMMFLTGTFFPTYLMPTWLQHITKYLPLTPINDGIRSIVNLNKSLFNVGAELAIIGVWTVVIYVIAFKVFRWE